jgi:hypothetical protein
MNRKNRQKHRQIDRQFAPWPPWQTHPTVVLARQVAWRGPQQCVYAALCSCAGASIQRGGGQRREMSVLIAW